MNTYIGMGGDHSPMFSLSDCTSISSIQLLSAVPPPGAAWRRTAAATQAAGVGWVAFGCSRPCRRQLAFWPFHSYSVGYFLSFHTSTRQSHPFAIVKVGAHNGVCAVRRRVRSSGEQLSPMRRSR
eukprot:6191805-Pleurochrysis_carterae.AAC.1